jgi:hypothetical protein
MDILSLACFEQKGGIEDWMTLPLGRWMAPRDNQFLLSPKYQW